MNAPPGLELGPITITQLVRYAGASGDLNPLHHDVEFAKSAGFPSPVVMGAFPAGWAVACVMEDFSEGPLTINVTYKKPLLMGDRVTLQPRKGGADLIGEHGGPTTAIDIVHKAHTLPEEGTQMVPPHEFVIEAGAVREFRHAVHAEDSWDQRAPGTFLVGVGRWRPDGGSGVRALGLDYRRMLHSRSTYVYVNGPLRVGEVLQVTEHQPPRTTRTRRNGDTLTVATVRWTMRDQSGVRAQLEYEMVELPEVSS